MRSSSTLVSVSSVSSRPSASVCRPLRAARSGTPNPAVQMVTRAGRTAPSAKHHRVRAAPRPPRRSRARRPRVSSSHLAIDRRPGSESDGASSTAAHQRDRAALLGQLGGRLDAGEPGADDGDRGVRVQLVDGGAQPLRVLEFRDGIGEFGCSGHRRRHRAGAADRIDDVVVVQRAARRQLAPCARRCRCGWRCRRPAGCRHRAACRSRRWRRRSRPRTGAAGSARRTSGAG